MRADALVTSLPGDALVLLVGPSGAGKSTWAESRFAPHEILSSDRFRELVAGDATDQSATPDAFSVLHRVARARVRRGLRTVVDATNLSEGARRALLRLARSAARPVIAVVFDVPLEQCLAWNNARSERRVPDEVIHRHQRQLPGVLARLPQEGYAAVHVVRPAEMRPG